jgi:hypothetical protein
MRLSVPYVPYSSPQQEDWQTTRGLCLQYTPLALISPPCSIITLDTYTTIPMILRAPAHTVAKLLDENVEVD